MRHVVSFLLLVAVAAAQSGLPPKLAEADKLIVVTTPDWNTVGGILTRYERTKKRGWKQVGQHEPVVVGKNGLGSDPRLAKTDPAAFSGPVKHEGDGRSPAGVFAITSTFGFAPSIEDSKFYQTVTPNTECIDDSSSRYYTRVLDTTDIRDRDWNSSEKMRTVSGYIWGAVVDYNMGADTVPGNGSCIFLHVWSGPGRGTAGCTAMPEAAMRDIMRWLNTRGRTALVQLPEAEYRRLQKVWELP